MGKLNDLLNGNQANHIIPFFWQHGEKERELRNYMEKIDQSGMKAVCVESRPHPDFLGPKWWKDMDIIMDEARKRKMKVWLLDDSHFPSGYADGKIKREFTDFKKIYLDLKHYDFVGPSKGSSFLMRWSKSNRGEIYHDDKILGIIAAKRTNGAESTIIEETLIDISKYYDDGVLYWDIPEGDWSIFCLVQTHHGGEKATKDYLNPIVPEATEVLINTVYEPHYERYKKDFGNTFSGFFSDEPRFGNIKGPDASIGRNSMVLPWRKDMLKIMKKEIDVDILKYLPLLFIKAAGKENKVRYEYMNLVSKLYGQNFTQKLGNWCRERDVEYIGHVIEDNNAHSRLGYGAGHYYRALWEQDMAGIDVVLGQIIPGMDKGKFSSFTSTGWDGEFFHYGLAKLASSLAHIDRKKQGRAMCEVFGAYGWAEGLKLMKWITDHMLVRGINYFVPHAFSPKKFPDPDCPPHLYAKGFNPQYRYLNKWSLYTNRLSYLLSSGKHIAPAAILYHAEAEWSGDYMLFQKPARELIQQQIDFDVLPIDIIVNSKVENCKLLINNEKFSCLIIPYSENLPKKLLKKLLFFIEQGLKIFFIDDIPQSFDKDIYLNKKLKKEKNSYLVRLKDLANVLKKEKIHEISSSNKQLYLRYYHYQHENIDVFMFFNEEPYESIETFIEVPLTVPAYVYDAFDNNLHRLETVFTENGVKFKLNLTAYESKIIIFSDDTIKNNNLKLMKSNKRVSKVKNIKGNWEISFATAKEYPKFSGNINMNKLVNLASPDLYPDFSGTIKYEIDFEVNEISDQVFLKIEELYETVDLWLNDKNIGIKIAPPYHFEVSNSLKKGKNHLKMEVTNTLVKNQKDFLSQYLIQDPSGIVGEIKLEIY